MIAPGNDLREEAAFKHLEEISEVVYLKIRAMKWNAHGNVVDRECCLKARIYAQRSL